MRVSRFALAGVLMLGLALPLPAQARERDLGEAVERLNDPQLQGAIAGAMAAMSEVLLSMRIGPMARAMEGMGDGEMSDIPADATLGDMMGEEARDLPREMSARVPQMMAGMAGMAGAMEQMLPQFEELGRRLKRQMPRR